MMKDGLWMSLVLGQAQTGMPAKGFVFGVSLDVPGQASQVDKSLRASAEELSASSAAEPAWSSSPWS